MRAAAPHGFVVPATGSRRGVLVLHPWWGLNDTIKAFCGRLAERGFFAFAPDLFDGRVADTIRDAEALTRSVDPDRARAHVEAAAAFLWERVAPLDGGLAVIGFSFGAWYALEPSVTDPERIGSVVVFYGTRPGDYRRSNAHYLGHFAETDPYEPQAEVDATEAALRSAGRPVTFHRYPGAGHWFFEPDRSDAFHPAAAELAWDRTLAFLRRAW